MSKDCCCDFDIFTEHAPLIHKGADIEFVLSYLNGIDPALITDLNDKHNVQAVLESFFSQHGVPVKHEIPVGAKNRVNLSYRLANEFVAGTLEVFLSGIHLNGNQGDPDRDFDTHLDNKGFTILLDPSKASRLNRPPYQDESLFVNYRKRITFNTIGGT